MSSQSEVVGLTVLGEVVPIPADEPFELEVPGVATIRVNWEFTETDEDGEVRHVRRALWVESALGDVVVGEAVVDHHDNPC